MKKPIKNDKFTTISLSKETVAKLQRYGFKAETYEDIIKKILIKYDKTTTVSVDLAGDKK